MNESKLSFDRTALIVSTIVFGVAISGLIGCDKLNFTPKATAAPSSKDVLGLTEAELRAKYPQMSELDRSFDLLVSKNLYPYQSPPAHKFLRFGSAYLVVELKDGRVIALHHVEG